MEKLSRRDFLRMAGSLAAGAALAACQPKTVIVEKEVEKEVTRVVQETVKETVVIEGTPKVVEKEVTKVVKEVVTATPAPVEAKTLEWWVNWGGIWGKACENIAQMYMFGRPNVQVNVLKASASLEKLLTAVAGGTAPDVMTSIWTADLAMRGAVLPLEDMMDATGFDRDNFYEAQWIRSSWDGKIYGVPGVESAFIVGLGWNKDLFAKAGLDPEKGPATWEELRSFSDAMTERDDAGNVTVMGFRPTDAIGSVLAVWASLVGADYFDPAAGKYSFDTPEMADALQYIVGFYQAYGPENMAAFSTNYGGWTGSANSAFTRGVQGMIINGYWMPGELAKLADPEVAFGYGWTPSRIGKDIQMIGGWSNVIPVDAADPELAFDLVVAVSSDEGSKIALDTAGGFCASKSFLRGIDASQYPGLDWFLNSGLEADEVVAEPSFPGYSMAQNNWNALIEEVAFGNQTIAAGLKELEEVTQKAYEEATKPGS
jgi:ABC-type glycerol-3-phosphate transport system substrate-binding protein